MDEEAEVERMIEERSQAAPSEQSYVDRWRAQFGSALSAIQSAISSSTATPVVTPTVPASSEMSITPLLPRRSTKDLSPPKRADVPERQREERREVREMREEGRSRIRKPKTGVSSMSNNYLRSKVDLHVFSCATCGNRQPSQRQMSDMAVVNISNLVPDKERFLHWIFGQETWIAEDATVLGVSDEIAHKVEDTMKQPVVFPDVRVKVPVQMRDVSDPVQLGDTQFSADVWNKMLDLYESSPEGGVAVDQWTRTAFCNRMALHSILYSPFLSESMVYSVRAKVLGFLRDEFAVRHECFASPHEVTLDSYNSMYEVDRSFGSQGSFLRHFHATTGIYEANPPWSELALMLHITHTLGLIRKADQQQHMLGFFVFWPDWVDSLAFRTLMENKDCIRFNLVIPMSAKLYESHEFQGTRHSLAVKRDQRLIVLASKALMDAWHANPTRLTDKMKTLMRYIAGDTRESRETRETVERMTGLDSSQVFNVLNAFERNNLKDLSTSETSGEAFERKSRGPLSSLKTLNDTFDQFRPSANTATWNRVYRYSRLKAKDFKNQQDAENFLGIAENWRANRRSDTEGIKVWRELWDAAKRRTLDSMVKS
jgi:hypothetical protein